MKIIKYGLLLSLLSCQLNAAEFFSTSPAPNYQLYGVGTNSEQIANNAGQTSFLATGSGQNVLFHSGHDHNYDDIGYFGKYIKNVSDHTVTKITPPNGITEADLSLSFISYMTANGRFMVIRSTSKNFPENSAGIRTSYLYDQEDGSLDIIARRSDGSLPSQDARKTYAYVSEDGKFVYFAYDGRDLETASSANMRNLYLWDVEQNTRKKINVDAHGNYTKASTAFDTKHISGDGTYVVYVANAEMELDSGILNGIYLYNRLTDSHSFISRLPSGIADPHAGQPSISIDGRYLTFIASSRMETGSDQHGSNMTQSIIHYDINTKIAKVISKDTEGSPFGHNLSPTISANGDYIAFVSLAGTAPVVSSNYNQAMLYSHVEDKLYHASVSKVDGSSSNNNVSDVRVLDYGQGVLWNAKSNNMLESEQGTYNYQVYLFGVLSDGGDLPDVCY